MLYRFFAIALVVILFTPCLVYSQPACNSWLNVVSANDRVRIGDLDVSGNQITVEAMINRTVPYSPASDYRYAGDIVSKHMDPTDCNYLLRPRHCEITTSNGFFATPEICDFQLNKTYHVAMVYDGSKLKFYRNGFLMAEVNATGTLFQNDYITTIGDKATAFNLPENLSGYINEVRIWNVARTQAQIRAGMNVTLPNPASQQGLLAYYTFNSLINKQGNAAWNGTLQNGAKINQTNPACSFIADSCDIPVTPPVSPDCNSWLKTINPLDVVKIGDLDVSGTQVTVEALFNRTMPYSPASNIYHGNIVSKHTTPGDCNYLLRPHRCEITTSDGFFATPEICDFDINKTYHVAMVYDGAKLKFYRNGFLMSEVNATGTLIQNNYPTSIGDLPVASTLRENMIGFINEVKIWNVARTQEQIKAGMNVTLSNPASQQGLLAYYTFNSLVNKQGNAAWNGTAQNGALINQNNPACSFTADSCETTITPPNTCLKVLQANYGGNRDDIAYDVVDAGAGQFYMVGNTTSFGAGGTDILVVKMDAAKNIIWSNTYGVSGDETARKASATPDGGLLITGQTKSFNNGRGDLLALKINPGGSLQWTRVFGIGSANGDLGSDIIQTANGGFAISGILDVAGLVADGVVIRLDQNANMVWAKRFTTPVGEDGSSIIESGNKLIASFDIEYGSGNDYGTIVSELQTSNGQLTGSKKIASTSKGIFRPMLYNDFSNGYWLSGHLISSSDYSQMEPIVLRLDNSYSITKSYKLQLSSSYLNHYYTGFAPLKSGGFLLCGTQTSGNSGSGHLFKVAADGKVILGKKVSTSGKSMLNGLISTGNKIITVGSDNQSGSNDFYIADFDSSGNNSTLCNVDTSIASTQSHPFTVTDFTWTNVSDITFNSPAQSLTASKPNILSNVFCSKDTCLITIKPDFVIPDTVCVNEPVSITNKTEGASSHFWSFCLTDLNKTPEGVNLGNIGGAFSSPVFMDYTIDNGKYYGFLVNYAPGNLIRLDFGNSLLNTPTATVLGNFGGIIPAGLGAEGIQLVKNEGKWYAIMVGGNITTASAPRIIKLDFGASLANTPVATNWGNIGNMDQPLDFTLFKEGNNWYGFTVSAENNTITRFAFGSSFDNTPTGTNLGNLGGMEYPTGIYSINDKGTWRLFIVNGGNNTTTSGNFSLTRLDFGSSLLNTPTGQNLGNPGGLFKHPRDISILRSCGQTIGFVVNGHPDFKEIIKLDFNDDLTKSPTATSLGNIGNVDFPHSISKLFRDGNDLYTFVTNVRNNSLTRLRFTGCSQTGFPNPQAANPGSVTYTQPGIYNINLSIDDGLATQSSICKQVVVVPKGVPEFSYIQDNCSPLNFRFFAADSSMGLTWDFGDGSSSALASPTHIYAKEGKYIIKLAAGGRCPGAIEKTIEISVVKSNIIITQDTVVCEGATVNLRSDSAIAYCWSPSTYLNNSSIRNPVAKPLSDITYYLTSKFLGTNLVVNSGFEQGNQSFTSDYKHTQTNSNGQAGEYFIGANISQWSGGMQACIGDHSGANGNMMMVNGGADVGAKVWSQTVSVVQNTNYEMSCWAQNIGLRNPARLQFFINGNPIGQPFDLNNTSCVWERFFVDWNSGSLTTIEISIAAMKGIADGNDFALDDISFAPISYKTDSVKVVIERNAIKAGNDTTVCSGSLLPLKATGGNSYSWLPSQSLDNANIATPIATVINSTRYIVIGKSALGCTASDTIQVNVFPKAIIGRTPDTTICNKASLELSASGGVSYKWTPAESLSNGSIPNPIATPLSSTKYYVDVVDGNGCNNKDSVFVTVAPPLVILVSNDTSICANQKVTLEAKGAVSYVWTPSVSLSNSNIASPEASPISSTQYTVVARDAMNCVATKSVMVTVLPLPVISLSKDTAICKEGSASLSVTGAASYNWLPAIGLDKTNTSTVIATPDATTTYTVEATGTNGCTIKESVTVSKLAVPAVTISADTTICGVGTVPLQAGGGVSYLWSPDVGLSSSSISNPLASPTSSTRYNVDVKDVNGCLATASVSVKVVPAMVTTISKDTSICIGGVATLSASGGDKFEWSPVTGLSNPGVSSLTATPSATATYSVKITDNNNCVETRSVRVQVMALPTVGISNDTLICTNGSVLLNATGGVKYEWIPANSLNNSTISNPTASPLIPTTYTVTVTNSNNCVNQKAVSVGIRPPANFGVASDAVSACVNQSVKLNAYGGDKYEWSPASGLSSVTEASPFVRIASSQVYTVTVSESICKEQATFTIPVTIHEPPVITVTRSNDVTCNVPTAQLLVSGAGLQSARWEPALGLSNPYTLNPIATPAKETSYIVTVKNDMGCVSVDSVLVKVANNNDFRLYQMPNAFTPNGDGNNDCFGVAKWGNVNILYFEIFNRWGELVFKGDNGHPCWGGTYKGQLQPSGNFIYRIKVEAMCGVVERKGNVVLVR